MAKTFLPLAKSPISTPDLWVKAARNWLASGVIKSYLNELQVYADSTGMQVKIKSGAANVQSIYFDSDAEEVLAIAAADATNPRIDRVIVRLDLPGDSIDFAILQGVPAVSPTAPALTQNNTRWEISLAQVYVGANVSTIAAGNVTDERYFVKNMNYPNVKDTTWITLDVLQNYWQWYGSGAYPAYRKDTAGNVQLKGLIKGGTWATGVLLCTLPMGYRPKDVKYCIAFDGVTSARRMQINPDGTILIADNGGSNVFLTLDTIIFPAEQ